MPVVDVVNLEGKKVGAGRAGGRGIWREGESASAARSFALVSARDCARARTRPRTRAKSAAQAASSGSRRALAARVSARSVRRCGAMAARCTDPSRAITAMRCRRKCCWARCARRSRRSLPTQKLTVVDAWALETHKTQTLRSTLGKLKFTKSALLVAHGENRNLELASRNLEGVKLSAPNGLQPYEVLQHDRLVLSKDAVARLGHTLDPEKTPVEVPDVETIAAAPAVKRRRKPLPRKRRKTKPAAKKAAKPATSQQNEGEGISHVNPPLSDYSPPDHHGKRFGRKRDCSTPWYLKFPPEPRKRRSKKRCSRFSR